MLKQLCASGVTHEQFVHLQTLVEAHVPSLKALMKLVTEQEITPTTTKILCPKHWKGLLLALASSSPVCGLVHPLPSTISLLKRIGQENITEDLEAMQRLQRQIPVLFSLIRSLKCCPQTVLQPIIKELAIKALAPFSQESVASTGSTTGVLEDDDDTDVSCFPQLPRIRQRGTYQADISQRATICTKKRLGHPSLLPGVFTVYCRHGICYGFKVMRVRESPNTAFTLLLERFHTAPENIIYDNSCNLHQYALNREPNVFKLSWFLVDRFHWPNHTGCSVGYNLSCYPQFNLINSQVVEQANSALSRIKSSLSYMSKENFMAHCTFYLWYRNRKLREQK